MFVRWRSVLPIPFEKAKNALVMLAGDPATAGKRDGGRVDELDRIGFQLAPIQVRKKVDLKFGEPTVIAERVLTAEVEWRATGPEALFPVWEGRLELAGHGPTQTLLTLSGNYFPPFGSFGKTVDEAAMNRIAKASVTDFGDRLGRALVERSETRPDQT